MRGEKTRNFTFHWCSEDVLIAVAGGEENRRQILSQWIPMSSKDHHVAGHYHQWQCYPSLLIRSHNKLMAFEYANMLIWAKAWMICFGLCRHRPWGHNTRFLHISILFVHVHFLLLLLLLQSNVVLSPAWSHEFVAPHWLVSLSLSLLFLGSAPTSGTTPIHATPTRM